MTPGHASATSINMVSRNFLDFTDQSDIKPGAENRQRQNEFPYIPCHQRASRNGKAYAGKTVLCEKTLPEGLPVILSNADNQRPECPLDDPQFRMPPAFHLITQDNAEAFVDVGTLDGLGTDLDIRVLTPFPTWFARADFQIVASVLLHVLPWSER